MRRTAGLILVAALVLTGCGSSAKDKRREAVNDYLGQVDTIQSRFAASFDTANRAYRDFANGTANVTAQQLASAKAAIIAARKELRGVTPPKDAQKLHELLLELYTVDVELGLEAIALQQYFASVRPVLLDLNRVNNDYRGDLSRTTTAREQASALDGYANAVTRVVKRFERLAAPAPLRSWQNAQSSRLESVAETGHSLARALRGANRNAVQTLINRFRLLLEQQPDVSEAQRDSLETYDDHLAAISRLQREITAEQQRLQKLLG